MFGLSVRMVWLVIAVAFGIAEAATLSLTMIWFSIGALAAIGTSYLTDSIFIQILVFGVVSITLLILVTKRLLKLNNSKDGKFWKNNATNYDAFIGKKGFVLDEITPSKNGIVKVRGEEWTAKAFDDSVVIEAGAEVVVKSIDGVKLIVEKIVTNRED